MKGLNQKATGLAQFLDSRGYSGAGDTVMKMAGTINRLEAENADLRAQLAAAEKRAGAAVEDIRACIEKHAYSDCEFCKYSFCETEIHASYGGCHACRNHGGFHDAFEWRGGTWDE